MSLVAATASAVETASTVKSAAIIPTAACVVPVATGMVGMGAGAALSVFNLHSRPKTQVVLTSTAPQLGFSEFGPDNKEQNDGHKQQKPAVIHWETSAKNGSKNV